MVTWVLLVPWDLSEVDDQGRVVPGGGGDSHGASIGYVGAAVVALAVLLLVERSTRRWASWFAVGGLGAWTVLFAWRAGSAETVGANLFLVPLVTVLLPLAVAVPAVVGRMAARMDR